MFVGNCSRTATGTVSSSARCGSIWINSFNVARRSRASASPAASNFSRSLPDALRKRSVQALNSAATSAAGRTATTVAVATKPAPVAGGADEETAGESTRTVAGDSLDAAGPINR